MSVNIKLLNRIIFFCDKIISLNKKKKIYELSQRYFIHQIDIFYISLDFRVICVLLVVRPKAPKVISQSRTEKRNQKFLVPSLSGDKAFSSRENNVRASKRAVTSSFFRTREKEEMSKPLNISSRIPRAALEQRTAQVSYRRLSAGESRGLVAVKKAKERRRRRRKKKKERRNDGGREKRIARRSQTAFGFYRRPKKREERTHIVHYWHIQMAILNYDARNVKSPKEMTEFRKKWMTQ